MTILDPRIPLDANHNPSDAKIDQDRFTLTGGFDRPAARRQLDDDALVHPHQARHHARLHPPRRHLGAPDVEADGFRQDAEFTDLYFDTHLAVGRRQQPAAHPRRRPALRQGRAGERQLRVRDRPRRRRSAQQPFAAHRREHRAPGRARLPRRLRPGGVEARPRFDVDAGLRLNHTKEELEGGRRGERRRGGGGRGRGRQGRQVERQGQRRARRQLAPLRRRERRPLALRRLPPQLQAGGHRLRARGRGPRSSSRRPATASSWASRARWRIASSGRRRRSTCASRTW